MSPKTEERFRRFWTSYRLRAAGITPETPFTPDHVMARCAIVASVNLALDFYRAAKGRNRKKILQLHKLHGPWVVWNRRFLPDYEALLAMDPVVVSEARSSGKSEHFFETERKFTFPNGDICSAKDINNDGGE